MEKENYADKVGVQLLTIAFPRELSFRVLVHFDNQTRPYYYGYDYINFVMPGNITARFRCPRKYAWCPPHLDSRNPYPLKLSPYYELEYIESLIKDDLPFLPNIFLGELIGEDGVRVYRPKEVKVICIPHKYRHIQGILIELDSREYGVYWRISKKQTRERDTYRIRIDSRAYPLRSYLLISKAKKESIEKNYKIPKPLMFFINKISFYNRYNRMLEVVPLIYAVSLDLKLKGEDEYKRIHCIKPLYDNSSYIVLGLIPEGDRTLKVEGLKIKFKPLKELKNLIKTVYKDLEVRLSYKILVSIMQTYLCNPIFPIGIFDAEAIAKVFALGWIIADQKTLDNEEEFYNNLIKIKNGISLDDELFKILIREEEPKIEVIIPAIIKAIYGNPSWLDLLVNNEGFLNFVIKVFNKSIQILFNHRESLITTVLLHTLVHVMRDAAAITSGIDSIRPYIDLKQISNTPSEAAIFEEMPATGFASSIEKNYDAYLIHFEQIEPRAPNDFITYLEELILTNKSLDTDLLLFEQIIPRIGCINYLDLLHYTGDDFRRKLEKAIGIITPSIFEETKIKRALNEFERYLELWIAYKCLKRRLKMEPPIELLSWFIAHIARRENEDIKFTFIHHSIKSDIWIPDETLKKNLNFDFHRTLFINLKNKYGREEAFLDIRRMVEDVAPIMCFLDDVYAIDIDKCSLGTPVITKYLLDYIFLRNVWIEMSKKVRNEEEDRFYIVEDLEDIHSLKNVKDQERRLSMLGFSVRIGELITYKYSSKDGVKSVLISCFVRE